MVKQANTKLTTPQKTRRKTPGKRFAWLRRDWQLYVMIAIPVIWYLVFCYKPMAGLVIAFQKYNIFKGIRGSQWVGLDNFKFVFQMRDFGIALKNTLWLNFLDLLVDVWQGMGWGTILYLAAITGLDQNLFEAARLDGANKLQQPRTG